MGKVLLVSMKSIFSMYRFCNFSIKYNNYTRLWYTATHWTKRHRYWVQDRLTINKFTHRLIHWSDLMLSSLSSVTDIKLQRFTNFHDIWQISTYTTRARYVDMESSWNANHRTFPLSFTFGDCVYNFCVFLVLCCLTSRFDAIIYCDFTLLCLKLPRTSSKLFTFN